MVEPGGLVLRLREQQELVPLEGVLGQAGVDQRVPASRDRQAAYLRRPRPDGVVRDDAALITPTERHALDAPYEVGGVGRLLEQAGPDGLQRRLGAHHREEPEGLGLLVSGEGVGGGREAPGGDREQGFRVECVFGCKHGLSPFQLVWVMRGRSGPST